MPKDTVFVRDDVLPSYWANAIQELVGSFISPNFVVRLKAGSTTIIEAPAGADDAQVGLTIDGEFRFNAATVERAHPGGAAGTYRVWVTSMDNDIDNSPEPYTDHTDRSFDLAITAAGVEPAVVPGSVEIWREVGAVDWDGADITALRQTSNSVVGAQIEDDAIDTGSSLSWTRQADGSMVLDFLGVPDESITAAKLAAALKSPADNVEGLRKLGTADGEALPGDHPSVTNARTPADESVGPDQMTDAVVQALGLTDSEGARRGKSIIAAEGSRTNAAFGALNNGPDQVSDIVVPTDGVLLISYSALVKQSASGLAGLMAIIIEGNELKRPHAQGAPFGTQWFITTEANDYSWMFTSPHTSDFDAAAGPPGWIPLIGGSAGAATSVATGMIHGQPIQVEVPAGTYDVSVQFKAASGTIYAKERKLRVEAKGF